MESKIRFPKISLVPACLALALVWTVLCLCVNPVPGADLFWQLRAGHDLVLNHRPPFQDTYSWTRFGTPWAASEWLSFLVFWEAYSAGGFGGVWCLMAAVTFALAFLLWRTLARETQNIFTAFGLAVLALLTAGGYLQPRPQLFTYFFLAAVLVVILPVRRGKASAKRLWVLVPLFLLWANLHPGVVVGVGILFTLALGDALESLWKPAMRPQTASFALIGVACGAATLLTPYGILLYQDVFATVTNEPAMRLVAEWNHYGGQVDHGLWGYPVLAGLIAICFVRTRERRSLGEALVLIVLVVQSFLHMRSIPLFAIGGAIIAARHIQGCLADIKGWVAQGSNAQRVPPSAFISCCLGAGIVLACTLQASRLLRTSPEAAISPVERIGRVTVCLSSYPDAAAQFMEHENFPTPLRLFNDYDLGGYLIWRVPRYPVFVDGRADVYLGAVLNDYSRIIWSKSRTECRPVLDFYQFDCVLTRHPERALLFSSDPGWAVVYADHPGPIQAGQINTWIFLRRKPGYGPLILHCRQDWVLAHLSEFQHITP